MRAILSNRMFQVGAAALVVGGLGYAYFETTDNDAQADTTVEAASNSSEQTETTEVSNTETTESAVSTENTAATTENSESAETVETTSESE